MEVICLTLYAPLFASEVLTHHNNPARTGAVLDEMILTPASIETQGIGKLFSFLVDGQIYAQPLVLSPEPSTLVAIWGKSSLTFVSEKN
jgi:hypothetical protein